MSEASNIPIEGVESSAENFSDAAKETIASILFVDARLQQLQNEWAVADTARLAYSAALKREIIR